MRNTDCLLVLVTFVPTDCLSLVVNWRLWIWGLGDAIWSTYTDSDIVLGNLVLHVLEWLWAWSGNVDCSLTQMVCVPFNEHGGGGVTARIQEMVYSPRLHLKHLVYILWFPYEEHVSYKKCSYLACIHGSLPSSLRLNVCTCPAESSYESLVWHFFRHEIAGKHRYN